MAYRLAMDLSLYRSVSPDPDSIYTLACPRDRMCFLQTTHQIYQADSLSETSSLPILSPQRLSNPKPSAIYIIPVSPPLFLMKATLPRLPAHANRACRLIPANTANAMVFRPLILTAPISGPTHVDDREGGRSNSTQNQQPEATGAVTSNTTQQATTHSASVSPDRVRRKVLSN